MEFGSGNDVASPAPDAVSDDVEGLPPETVPLALKDGLPELPCWFWPSRVGIDTVDDVPLDDCPVIPDTVLLVDSCDVGPCAPEPDSLELVPVAVPPSKLLSPEIDVDPPSLDVLPDAKLLAPVLLVFGSWLDRVPTVVELVRLDPVMELSSPSSDAVLDVVPSPCDTVDVVRDEDILSKLLEAVLSVIEVLGDVLGEERVTILDMVTVTDVVVAELVPWLEVSREVELEEGNVLEMLEIVPLEVLPLLEVVC